MKRACVVWAAICCAQSACGGASPASEDTCGEVAPIALRIVATDGLNPDATGAALPTELRLYQLSDASALEHTGFEDVWRDGSGALGDALVAEETLTIYPGQRVERTLRPDDATTALAAVIIVREPAGRTWRAVAPISRLAGDDATCPALSPRALTYRLDRYRVEALLPMTTERSSHAP